MIQARASQITPGDYFVYNDGIGQRKYVEAVSVMRDPLGIHVWARDRIITFDLGYPSEIAMSVSSQAYEIEFCEGA